MWQGGIIRYLDMKRELKMHFRGMKKAKEEGRHAADLPSDKIQFGHVVGSFSILLIGFATGLISFVLEKVLSGLSESKIFAKK